MQNQIREADFVLVVCTEIYKLRFEGQDPHPGGKGAKWEGAIITQQLYEAEGKNTKFIPVLFEPEDRLHIPDIFQTATYYDVSTSNGYDLLYRYLSNQPPFPPPPIPEKLRAAPPLRRGEYCPSIFQKEVRDSVCLIVSSEIVHGLLFLLMLDQYPTGGWPEGVWGRSLAPTSGFFGHEGDPGSISVSCWALQALRGLFPAEDIPEANNFREYLLSRQKANGGIGMRKNVGSGKAAKYEIIENRRHTALGAKFLIDNNCLDSGLLSLRYVLDHRTPGGAWSATGDISDGNADPLTTAYVLSVLKVFDEQGLLRHINFRDREHFFKTYWKAGCLWLYANLIKNEWWLYKTDHDPVSSESLSRAYVNTGDTLMAVTGFRTDDSDHAFAHKEVVEALKRLWDDNSTGIPNGNGTDRPSLEATVYLARTCWLCRDRYPELAKDMAVRFIALLKTLVESGESSAAAWSMTLTFLNDMQALVLEPGLLERTRRQAKTTWEAMQTNGVEEAVSAMSEQPAWVREIAKQRILPVYLTPP